jgi:hypothetical protein
MPYYHNLVVGYDNQSFSDSNQCRHMYSSILEGTSIFLCLSWFEGKTAPQSRDQADH